MINKKNGGDAAILSIYNNYYNCYNINNLFT